MTDKRQRYAPQGAPTIDEEIATFRGRAARAARISNLAREDSARISDDINQRHRTTVKAAQKDALLRAAQGDPETCEQLWDSSQWFSGYQGLQQNLGKPRPSNETIAERARRDLKTFHNIDVRAGATGALGVTAVPQAVVDSWLRACAVVASEQSGGAR